MIVIALPFSSYSNKNKNKIEFHDFASFVGCEFWFGSEKEIKYMKIQTCFDILKH